jgi:uncharacterized protein (TIGR00255 family)
VTVSSMTGFARAEGSVNGFGWSWEVRSVNSRSLDIRLRLPSGFEAVEAGARTAISGLFARGSVNGTLSLDRSGRPPTLSINQNALDQIIEIANELSGRVDAEKPRIDGLLSIRGVVEANDREDTAQERAELEDAIRRSFEEAVQSLRRARNEEGARLDGVVSNHIDEIESLSQQAASLAAMLPAALEKRLHEQIATICREDPKLSEERIAQEVALLLVKADVREELDRLSAHVSAARDLLKADEPVGRRLDFLCQEFNREANTLCSKSSDIELTRIGLDLKACIDRLREQIQNIE